MAPEQRILGVQNRDFGADINFRVNLMPVASLRLLSGGLLQAFVLPVCGLKICMTKKKSALKI